jgi:hypothetical protein
MRPHNLFDNGQPQAGPVFPTTGAGRIGLIEPVEDVRQGLGQNPRAGICHLYLNPGASLRGPECDGSPGRREF